jgi:glycosyltransferase involved in cell wall biosynthesis
VTTPLLVIVPAHNEAASLPSVVAEVRAALPHADLLVVDDGSEDGTQAMLSRAGVASLRFPRRVGVGTAVRAGLVHGFSRGHRVVVRMDGDGQHDPRDIQLIVEPLSRGADVVVGTRFQPPSIAADRTTPRRFVQRVLATVLSRVTGRRVTDATSGFCAFGPRAVALLTSRHPPGYPEVELRLLLHREGLEVHEVPVRERPRLAGRTTLTATRLALAAARAAFAIARFTAPAGGASDAAAVAAAPEVEHALSDRP